MAMTLNQENYYDKKTDKEYMSFSLFKNLISNPARALADINGEYPWFGDRTALLVGQYLHSYFESKEAHFMFLTENEEEMTLKSGKNKGQLKQQFQVAQDMIDRLEKEEHFVNEIDSTEKEVIIKGKIRSVTENGEIVDVDWKGKVDALDVDAGIFYDFKTVRTLIDDGAQWDNEKHERVNFIISRRYDVQMAIYKELLEQMYGKTFTPIIWAVSKTKEPLAKPFMLTKETLEEAMQYVQDNQLEAVAYRDGLIEAPLKNDGSDYYNFAHRVTEETDYEKV